jgi:hypothetical protein
VNRTVNNQTVENWTELFFLDTGYHGTIYGIVYHTIMYAVFGVILEKKASSSYIIYHVVGLFATLQQWF